MELDRQFTGSIPELYNRYLVPLLFEPYAEELASRVTSLRPRRVLETAAGTGAVTRALRRRLPFEVAIVATDLNQAMLDVAAGFDGSGDASWRQADAQSLPFGDSSFDVVVCQFGVMFFPDRAQAFREAFRVLTPGGHFLFNVWERIESNPFMKALQDGLKVAFPEDPPLFLERTPHGHHDRNLYLPHHAAAGFMAISVDTVRQTSRAESARDVATTICEGSPLRSELEARGPGAIEVAVEAATEALRKRFGSGPVEAPMEAFVVTAKRA